MAVATLLQIFFYFVPTSLPLHLFNVYINGVVQEVNVRVRGKGLELLSANGGRFEINQLLFADDRSQLLRVGYCAVV